MSDDIESSDVPSARLWRLRDAFGFCGVISTTPSSVSSTCSTSKSSSNSLSDFGDCFLFLYAYTSPSNATASTRHPTITEPMRIVDISLVDDLGFGTVGSVVGCDVGIIVGACDGVSVTTSTVTAESIVSSVDLMSNVMFSVIFRDAAFVRKRDMNDELDVRLNASMSSPSTLDCTSVASVDAMENRRV